MPGVKKNKGLSQNVTRFVILRSEATKDLSFQGYAELFLERFFACAQNDTVF